MFVIDPENNPLTVEQSPAPADAAAAPEPVAPAGPAAPAAVEVDPIDTIDQAIAAAEPEGIAPAAAPAPAAEPTAPDAAPPTPPAENLGPDGKPLPPEPAADPDVEAQVNEAKAEGATTKTQDRIRTMANEIKTLAPIREALTAAGINDLAELPRVLQDARDGRDLVQMVSNTGAPPEQFGMTLDYLTVASKARSGDLAAAKQAYELTMGEATGWAKILGLEVPGVHDPLEAHNDLKEQVAAGDLSRKLALEIASTRQRESVIAHATTQRQQQEAITQEEIAGRQALQAFDAEMTAADPTYAAKRPMLNTMVAMIRQTVPPRHWAEATRQAYQTIPAQAAPAPAPPSAPPPGPVRPMGHRPAVLPDTTDPIELIDRALGVTPAA